MSDRAAPPDCEWIGTEQDARDFAAGMMGISGAFTRLLGAPPDDTRGEHRRALETKAKSKRAVRCADCRRWLMSRHYSTNQWTKPAPRCTDCCQRK